MTRYTSDPPEELWRIAYRTRVPSGSDTVEQESIDYFEDEAKALGRLNNLVPSGGTVLSIHKLEPVTGQRAPIPVTRWVELAYTPPAAHGTLMPVPPPQAAKP